MTTLGTPLSPSATRVLLLGSGELGKEVAIELQRFGVEVIAADRYANAPAMQVAHRSHVLDMLDPQALRALIAQEQPHLIVPEIEAIHTETLVALEHEQGQKVIPTARAARLTMDREGIRRLAAETLGLPTSPYRFVDTAAEYREAIAAVGLPCVVKPVMSSSGKGQSTLRSEADIDAAWDYAQTGGRAGAGRCIVEGFIDFDYEITLLTVRHAGGTSFCDPIDIGRKMATTAKAGSRSRCRPRRCAARRRLHRQSLMSWAAGGCLAWSCSSRATRCGSAKSRRARTTPAWSRWCRRN